MPAFVRFRRNFCILAPFISKILKKYVQWKYVLLCSSDSRLDFTPTGNREPVPKETKVFLTD